MTHCQWIPETAEMVAARAAKARKAALFIHGASRAALMLYHVTYNARPGALDHHARRMHQALALAGLEGDCGGIWGDSCQPSMLMLWTEC